MIQRGEQLRLALSASRRDLSQKFWQDFDGDLAPEPTIACAIHLAHAACTDGGDDFIRPETNAGSERHWLWRLGDCNPQGECARSILLGNWKLALGTSYEAFVRRES